MNIWILTALLFGAYMLGLVTPVVLAVFVMRNPKWLQTIMSRITTQMMRSMR